MLRLSDGLEFKEMGPDSSGDRQRAILNYIHKSLRASWRWCPWG